jgi:hypothetical protein
VSTFFVSQVLQQEAFRQDKDEAASTEARWYGARITSEQTPPLKAHNAAQRTPFDQAETSSILNAPTPADLFPTPGSITDAAKRKPPPSTPKRTVSADMAAPAASPFDAKRHGTPIVDGYIRARARTPQRSLGPPQRVVASLVPQEPHTGHSMYAIVYG